MTVSVQDTVGSVIAYSAIVHLGATVPPRTLRHVLNCEDMVTLKTARFDAPTEDGRVLPPDAPGLGIEVDESALGEPIAVWNS
ncbi:enolase C-terminal domain-like protein [Nocardiopsis composta]|uniref:enolase C-terminal domain-like protein n=1 Tax=Nocardiopsis composta TaxID=157465 RepID=UPI0031DEB4C4